MVNMQQRHHLVPKRYHNITANTVLTAMLKIIMTNHIIQVALNTTGAVMSTLIRADKDSAKQRVVSPQALSNAVVMKERIVLDKRSSIVIPINRQVGAKQNHELYQKSR